MIANVGSSYIFEVIGVFFSLCVVVKVEVCFTKILSVSKVVEKKVICKEIQFKSKRYLIVIK